MAWPKGVPRTQKIHRPLLTNDDLAEVVTTFGIERVPIRGDGAHLYQLVKVKIQGNKVIGKVASEPTTRIDVLQAFQRHTYDAFWEERESDFSHV